MKVTPPLQPRWGLPLAALSLLLLSACGGGSGGGLVQNQNTINSGGEISGQDMFDCQTQPTAEPCAQPPAENQGDDGANGGSIFITQDTAPSVTKAVIGIIERLYGFGGLDGAAANMLASVTAFSPPARMDLLRFLEKQLRVIGELDQQGLLHTPSVVGVHMEAVVDCRSGSASSEPSGDGEEGIDIGFDDCEIGGKTLNGDITVSGIRRNGNPGNPAGTWELAADFAFRGFNISSANETVSYSGALQFTLASNDGDIEGHLIVTRPLGISVAGLQNDFLRNEFALEYAYDSSTNDTVLAVRGILQRGTSSNNILTISTPRPLTLNPNVDGINLNGQRQGPYLGGQLRIISNNQTGVVLHVQGNLSVILIVNGSDPGLSLSWEELLAG